MFRIDHPTAVASLPVVSALGTQGFFSKGNPGGGQPATVVTDEFLNMLQEELRAVIAAASLTPSKTDNTQLLQALNVLFTTGGLGRTRLSANTNYYVATTGSDSNTGAIGSKWLTLQHAYDWIVANIDCNGFTPTINVADGTYSAGLLATVPAVGGVIAIVGNLTTPANCIISSGGSPCIAAVGNLDLNMAGGFKLTGTSHQVLGLDNAFIKINGAMEYGSGGGLLQGQIAAFFGGVVSIAADYKISGGAGQHYYTSAGHIHVATGITVTLTGTPAYAGQFALAVDSGSLDLYPVTYSGAASGTRDLADMNGIINTNGGGLPSGLSAGTPTRGGQYA